MNFRTGVRRVCIVLYAGWVFGGLALYLLDWPGNWLDDPESQPLIKASANVMACQNRARDYDREEQINSAFRRVPEIPNFGRDERGLQITRLQDALGECERRYPYPRTAAFSSEAAAHFWRELFRSMRHEGYARDAVPHSITYISVPAGMFLVIPVLFYILLYGLVWVSVFSVRWIQRGFGNSSV